MSDFSITSELLNNVLILRTDGYINNVGGERIVQEFSKYSVSSINKVILDLEKSKVINSIGISYLIEIIETTSQNNCKLVFINLDPTIDKTFNIMGLFQFAEKADSADAALI